MKRSLIIFSMLLAGQLCLSQEVSSFDRHLAEVSDSLVNCEVSTFTVKGKMLRQSDPQQKAQLIEVPVSSCTGNRVNLNIWSTYITLIFKDGVPDKMLDSIFLVTHSHFWVTFPKSAFQDLPQSNSCNFNANNKRDRFFSPYYKAFYSTDKRRSYIYMLGGTGDNKYEVTWVLENDRYRYRIIDEI